MKGGSGGGDGAARRQAGQRAMTYDDLVYLDDNVGHVMCVLFVHLYPILRLSLLPLSHSLTLSISVS